jgi:hypothetical protein
MATRFVGRSGRILAKSLTGDAGAQPNNGMQPTAASRPRLMPGR